jgi:hypothetical protein
MHSDSFYTKGTTHKECQDYATHGCHYGMHYAMVSDGCSSAPKSDFGARLLSQSAVNVLAELHQSDIARENRGEWITSKAIRDALDASAILNLPIDCLCSTLLFTTVLKNESSFYALVSGDGFVVAKKADGLEIHEYEFEKGAPFYLRYSLNPTMLSAYWQRFGRTIIHTKYELGNFSTTTVDRDAPEICPKFFEHYFPFDEYEWVAVLTDGSGSFLEMINNGTSLEPLLLSPDTVLKDLLNFKNFQGEFVQRRCSKAFKDFTKKHWQNTDDFSIAAITQL